MGREIQWHGAAWEEYCQWQQTSSATVKRINALIKDARRDPFHGIGKPEPLRHDLSGLWSRRINDTDRLTYCPAAFYKGSLNLGTIGRFIS